jgi:mono/diheme cytochrome c family protein
MTRETARTVAITGAATILVLLGAAVAYIYSGLYSVAATDDHTALATWALNTMQERSVSVRAGRVAEPPPIDSAMLAHGFEHFSTMCVVCHGAPGVERGEFGKGITPTPPSLSERAAEYTPRELFWIAKHGIKLAGMPAFGRTHSDEEIWAIVAFVDRLPEMDPETYQAWVERHAPEQDGDGHVHAGH